MRSTIILLCAALCGFAPICRAELRLPALITNHMVLQRDCPARIWGWADPDDTVTVCFKSQQKSNKADSSGRWLVVLDPLPASDKPADLLVSTPGKNQKITVRDILVGEVWVCAGQSNMKSALRDSTGGKEAVAAADNPSLRLFEVATMVASKPLDDVTGKWGASSPKTASGFSAVGWYFGAELQRRLGVPVGLIQCAEGSTRAEFWVSRKTLDADPEFQWAVRRWEESRQGNQALAAIPDLMENLHEHYRAGRVDTKIYKNVPSGLYYGMLRPLTPFAIRGVIWYQGESNAGRAHAYRKLLPALIKEWRRDWGQGDFPFLIVQLPQIAAWPDFAELREAQLLAAKNVPNTDLAVTFDCGDPAQIHPPDKRTVGQRLALIARSRVYGEKIEYSGPSLCNWKREENAIRLSFAHAEGGLVAKDDKPLTGFIMAGDDRVFHPATARIDGSSVVVSCEQVLQPATVRYAWADNPPCSLYNRAGLPASPFRLDDWPTLTGRDISEARTNAEQMEYIVGYYIRLKLRSQALGCLDAWQGEPLFKIRQLVKLALAAKADGDGKEAAACRERTDNVLKAISDPAIRETALRLVDELRQ